MTPRREGFSPVYIRLDGPTSLAYIAPQPNRAAEGPMRHSAAFFVSLLLVGLARPAPAAEKWNLVAVVTDDQARWSVGAYGNKECRTPNMDRLAREGARFLNAFVPTPV